MRDQDVDSFDIGIMNKLFPNLKKIKISTQNQLLIQNGKIEELILENLFLRSLILKNITIKKILTLEKIKRIHENSPLSINLESIEFEKKSKLKISNLTPDKINFNEINFSPLKKFIFTKTNLNNLKTTSVIWKHNLSPDVEKKRGKRKIPKIITTPA